MNIVQIEKSLKKLMKFYKKETFIYDLLLAYGLPKASITRLQKGNLNLSKVKGELSWKKKVFFKEEFEKDLHVTLLGLAEEIKHDQRFVIVTDYNLLLAIDTKTKDKLDVNFKDLAKNYDFFLPWAGMEKTQHQNENPADVKAAERMAKLFDEIKKDNPNDDEEFNHGLNVFLSRLLFCFFAEDTDIFEDNQFTNAISSHTQADGSDLGTYLDDLFEVLNTPDDERKGLPAYLEDFPYVNGGLFRQRHSAPGFSRKSRQLIIEAGELNWKDINPDIFGSMFQGVIDPEKRGSLGAHYTSVPNIMKVIEPLFLNELNEAYEKGKGNSKKISELLHRLSQIKIFDPACGSGNFLIIAYKELRRLEMKVFRESNMMAFSQISLSQFYGIELDDFAHEIAQLSLWLAEHQMNVEFFKQFGRSNPTLPLKEAGKIVCGNACRLDWEEICPPGDHDVYILGNPPYIGSKNLNSKQKLDIEFNFGKQGKTLDYISIWFLRAKKYGKKINKNFAFVSTNSICQGEQVSKLWPLILDDQIFISFAYTSFKWTNSAKSAAGVTVVIVGLSNNSNKKRIYSEYHFQDVKNITPYLTEGETTYIVPSTKQLCLEPEMIGGNVAYDSGNLVFSEEEKSSFVSKFPESKFYFKELLGGKELLNGGIRYCLWFKNYSLNEVNELSIFNDLIENVKNARLSAKDKGTHKLAERPHQFRDLNTPETFIAIPKTSSEKRSYIPMKFIHGDVIASDSIRLIANAEIYLFSILNSRMHMAWVNAVSGRLEERIRYSKNLSYNTFPFPNIKQKDKEILAQCALRIIEVREKFPEKSLADLYSKDKMPSELTEVHSYNDIAVDKLYSSKRFNNDKGRLELLFRMYKRLQIEKNNRCQI